jgi:hypothetical protein
MIEMKTRIPVILQFQSYLNCPVRDDWDENDFPLKIICVSPASSPVKDLIQLSSTQPWGTEFFCHHVGWSLGSSGVRFRRWDFVPGDFIVFLFFDFLASNHIVRFELVEFSCLEVFETMRIWIMMEKWNIEQDTGKQNELPNRIDNLRMCCTHIQTYDVWCPCSTTSKTGRKDIRSDISWS